MVLARCDLLPHAVLLLIVRLAILADEVVLDGNVQVPRILCVRYACQHPCAARGPVSKYALQGNIPGTYWATPHPLALPRSSWWAPMFSSACSLGDKAGLSFIFQLHMTHL